MEYINANENFLGDDLFYSGNNIGIIVIDSGINFSCQIGKSIQNIAQENCYYVKNGHNNHGHRIAALCAGSMVTGIENKFISIAPNAIYYSDSYLIYRSIEELIDVVTELVTNHREIKVVGLPFSMPLNTFLALEGNKWFDRLTSQFPDLLIIAAAGHDGSRNLRFPATADSVLAVGVYDNEDETILKHCGSDEYFNKPEILVSDRRYQTAC